MNDDIKSDRKDIRNNVRKLWRVAKYEIITNAKQSCFSRTVFTESRSVKTWKLPKKVIQQL